MAANEVNREAIFKSVTCALLVSLGSIAWAESARPEKTIPFNIPRQRADLSLTEFAEKADITFVFPVDIAREVTANELVGEYSVQDALRLLLEDTSLSVKIGEDGQLMISSNEPTGDIDSMHKKNKLSTIIGILSSLAATQAVSQEPMLEEVLVKGIRGSLQRSMDIKRNT